MKTRNLTPLKPDYPQHDFFMCDLSDAILKDDRISMEHPVFTLSKKPDTKIRSYEHNGAKLTITPSVLGHATIYDKDILIYAISKVMQAKNRGEKINQYIIFEAQECLRFVCRTTKNGNPGGENYRRLETALKRLKGTMLQTDIPTGNITQTNMFGLIDSVTIHRENSDGRVIEWGLKFSDWTWNAINANDVLTLHRDYFRLRKPLEKRVYEIARRHCNSKDQWSINLELLLKKTGSSSPKALFKQMLKAIEKTDHLPDYHIMIDDRNMVHFRLKSDSNIKTPRPKYAEYTVDNLDNYLDEKAHATTRQLAIKKNRDWYSLKAEFAAFLNKTGETRKNISASFIRFIQNK